MKVLIIGDYPNFHGGVTNYTRPLAKELSNKVEVFYLYNTTRTGENTFFSGQKIIQRDLEDFNIQTFQLINGKAGYKNFTDPQVDVENWFDKTFLGFLEKIKPDIVHINEIFGFSSSIIKLLKKHQIKVFVTVHEYWWLCPHRVMVDFNKRICEGPTNISKCAFCISSSQNFKSTNQTKVISKLKNDFPKTFDFLFKVNKAIKNTGGEDLRQDLVEDIDFLDIDWKVNNPKLEDQIAKRLSANIDSLNLCDKVIAVSQDVKNILGKYGVEKDRILVQHIGSTIAEKTIAHTKTIDPQKITFGFIGGVGYYKGVHQLVDAFSQLPEHLKSKAELKIFGKYSETYYRAIENKFLRDRIDNSRIKFFGKFSPDDIPNISNQIDISVLPSLCADTAPQTIFESFSSGLPVIGPNVGGYSDFVKHEVNGLIYEAADVASLKQALIKIIENPSLIVYFQKNISPSKTLKENVAELYSLYQEG